MRGTPAPARRMKAVEPNQSRRVGLSRALSKLGYCSRSQAALLIRDGQVRLNGEIRRDPETPVRLQQDRITVRGQMVEARKRIYLMMNKPRGLVTTTSDEKGRETVYSMLEKSGIRTPWVGPVGRLDKASEGLLLLTNDSEWGARIAAPETHLEKTYHVQIGAVADPKLLARLVDGIKTPDGAVLSAKRVRIVRSAQKTCWLEVILDEGRNRQIRRMMETLGIQVLRLIRIAIGPLQLGQLAKGTYRALTRDEKHLLDEAINALPDGKERGLV